MTHLQKLLFVVIFLPILISCQVVSSRLTPTLQEPTTPVLKAVTPISETPVVEPTLVNTPTYEPTMIPQDINPLTGLPVEDAAKLNRLPVLIKVSNYPRTGRPHAGLSSADIVFDYYVGEMFNRFVAVFYGNDAPQVGPIRSGRLVDSQLTQMFRVFWFMEMPTNG